VSISKTVGMDQSIPKVWMVESIPEEGILGRKLEDFEAGTLDMQRRWSHTGVLHDLLRIVLLLSLLSCGTRREHCIMMEAEMYGISQEKTRNSRARRR